MMIMMMIVVLIKKLATCLPLIDSFVTSLFHFNFI